MFTKLILKWFPPRNAEHALLMKRRLAMAYAFFGWNSFIVLFYTMYSRQMPEDFNERKILLASRSHKAETIRVLRIDGFSVVENKTETIDKKEDTTENNTDKEVLEIV